MEPIDPHDTRFGDTIRREYKDYKGNPIATEFIVDDDNHFLLKQQADTRYYLLHRPEPEPETGARIGWCDGSPAMVWEITSQRPRERSAGYPTTTGTEYETIIVSNDPHEEGMILERIEGKAERVLKGRFTDGVIVPKNVWEFLVEKVNGLHLDVTLSETAEWLIDATRCLNGMNGGDDDE